MSYFSQLGLGSSGTGYSGGWRKGDVAEGGDCDLHILCTGKIVDGTIQLDIAAQRAPAPLVDEQPVDGDLQRLIEEGEATAEYEDYLADVEWLRSGC